MRTVNITLLNEWFTKRGEQAAEWLAAQSRCSISTVNRVKRGAVPRGAMRLLISRTCGIPEDQLFPVAAEESARQSNG